MTADDYIKLIGAIVAALAVIGTGIGALVKWVVGGFIAALRENTAAITASAKLQAKSGAAVRLELRAMRVEIRTLLGMPTAAGSIERPRRASAEDSDDDEEAVDDMPPLAMPPLGLRRNGS
jgi:hypothetical protein